MSGDTGSGSIGELSAGEKSMEADPLPPILVAKAASGVPFLGASAGHGGSALKNAALLALLGFLVK